MEKINFFKKKFDVIIDEVDGLRQFKKFEKIVNKFDNPIIFTKDKNVHEEVNNKEKNQFGIIEFYQVKF